MKGIKRFVVALVLTGLLMGAATRPVSAHVQASDNGVSAVMHILPDDNPVAGAATYIQFTFGGAKGNFDIARTDTELTVVQGSKTISETPVEPLEATGSAGHVVVTFPADGIYDLRLSGQPLSKNGSRFKMSFVVRVSPSGQTANLAGAVDVLFVSLGSLVVLGIFAYYNISGGRRYTKSKK
jgi:hypothetical protein